MAGTLKAASNSTLGFLGLNTQDSGVTLEDGYAKRAINCIIDRYGRLGSRRGWQMLTTDSGTLAGTDSIDSVFEFRSLSGSSLILSAGGNKIYQGLSTLAEIPISDTDASGPIDLAVQPTFTANRWQWAALQEGTGAATEANAFAGQIGHPMLVWREGGGSGPYVLQRIGDYGTIPAGVGTFDPDCVHAAFGRVWTGRISDNKTTVYYSQLLAGSEYTGAGSGVLDIGAIVGGNDEIVAISSHNNFLIIFCHNNIVIYQNADDPTNLALADVISGVGCIARDTVQQTGTDLIFLSQSGVRSLQRTLQEKTVPMRELSLNIRDDLVSYIGGEPASTLRSVYFERDAFYLLVLPGLNQTVCFDMRTALPNGASRATIWDGIVPSSAISSYNRNLYFGFDGGIARYFGYTDGGAGYRLEYFTSNTDFKEPFSLKFLKKAKIIIIASGSQDIIVKYGFDYSTTYSSRTFTKDLIGGSAEYNIAEYNLSEFTSGVGISEVALNLGGSGKVLEFGVEIPINGAPVSLQEMSVYMKTGKTI